MKISLRFLPICAAVILLFSAQASSAPQYSPLPGVRGTVKIKGQATLDQRVEISLLTSDGRPRERVFADSLGNFQFLSVGAGHYIIVIDVPGYRRIEERVDITAAGSSRTLTQRNFLLEPIAPVSAVTDPQTISAAKFLVSKEAREAFEKGEKELNKRNYAAAALHLDRAIAAAPGFTDALHARGLAALQQNQLPQARDYFAKAVAANPQHGDAQIAWGSALVRLGQSGDAIQALSTGLTLVPKSYLGRFERCRAFLQLNRLAEAEQDCLQARAVARDEDIGLHVLLGNLYLQQGRQPDALREFQNYLRKDPRSATADAIRQTIDSLQKAGAENPR